MQNTVGFTYSKKTLFYPQEKKFVPILKNLKEIWEEKNPQENEYTCMCLALGLAQ